MRNSKSSKKAKNKDKRQWRRTIEGWQGGEDDIKNSQGGTKMYYTRMTSIHFDLATYAGTLMPSLSKHLLILVFRNSV